jgi:hypothetical protein
MSDRRRFDALSGLWLLAVAALMSLTYGDYGIIWDAQVQNDYGKKLLDWYLSGFRDRSAFHYDNLYLYGGGFDLLAALLNRVSPLGEYETRNLLGGMVGVLGLAGTWRLARHLAGARAGFLALVLLTLVPDYYGHMPINPKDVPFAAAMIWTLHFMVRSLDELPRPRLPTVLWLGLCLGLALGIRVGAVLAGLYLLLMLGWYLMALGCECRDWRRVGRTGLGLVRAYLPALPLAYAVMALCWPWAVQSPLNPLEAIRTFAHFTWPNSVLAAGVVFPGAHPPLWYLPLMLAVKLPELMLLSLALGLAWAGLGGWARCRRQEGLVLLAALFPLGYFLFARPEVYNGIRHFLFMVPPLAVLAGLALDRGWEQLEQAPRWLGRGALAAFGTAVLLQGWVMAELHPNQFIYYNALVGGVKGAEGRFELDYWGTSVAQAAEELAAYAEATEGDRNHTRRYKVLVCAHPLSAMYFLPKRFELTTTIAEGDFFIGMTLSDCDHSVAGRPVIRVERFGATLAVVKDRRDLKAQALALAPQR